MLGRREVMVWRLRNWERSLIEVVEDVLLEVLREELSRLEGVDAREEVGETLPFISRPGLVHVTEGEIQSEQPVKGEVYIACRCMQIISARYDGASDGATDDGPVHWY